MAITTLDGAIAGMQPPVPLFKAGTAAEVAGVPHSMWYQAGYPGAAAAPAAGVAGETLSSSTVGAFPYTNPSSGNGYLARLALSGLTAGNLILCDRLWQNSGLSVTLTSAQAVGSVAWPSRCPDSAGGAPDTDGHNIMVGMEVVTATGAGTGTLTLSQYTNSVGTAGRAGPATVAINGTMVAGTFYRLPLQAGDVGVRSIQTGFTLSATMTSGTIALVAYREIASLPLVVANVPNAIDVLTAGMPRIFDSSCLFFLWVPSATTSTPVAGQIVYTHG